MADKSTIVGPSSEQQGDIVIGTQVSPGSRVGSLNVFDTGVPFFSLPAGRFGQTGSQLVGFQAFLVEHDNPSAVSLDSAVHVAANVAAGVLAGGATATTDSQSGYANLEWKRSITLLADSNNAQTVYVGDVNTLAHATALNCRGFPLAAGASITLEITRGSEIYFDCHTADCTMYWIAV
jgi:hypothetical protein